METGDGAEGENMTKCDFKNLYVSDQSMLSFGGHVFNFMSTPRNHYSNDFAKIYFIARKKIHLLLWDNSFVYNLFQ